MNMKIAAVRSGFVVVAVAVVLVGAYRGVPAPSAFMLSNVAAVMTATVVNPIVSNFTGPPNAPVPKLNQISRSSVTMTWPKVSRGVGYDLYLNGTQIATTSAPIHVFRALICSTDYTFGVDAYDSAGRHSTISTLNGTTLSCGNNGMPGQVLIGAKADQDGNAAFLDSTSSENDVLALEARIGRTLAIDNQYANWYDFSSTSPLLEAAWDIAGGRIPMISWKTDYPGHPPGCATWSAIVNGQYDAQLVEQAGMIKALGSTVFIRWHYEMEHPQGGNCFYDVDVVKDPVTAGKEYVAAWDHVYDLFKAQNVTNVEWVWAPGGDAYYSATLGGPTDLWKDFYPGDDYVDWVGGDLYNKSPTTTESIAVDPRFSSFYTEVGDEGKPLMLSETGAVGPDPQADENGYGCTYSTGANPDPGTMWIQTAEALFKTEFTSVHAFVYWDNVGDGGPFHCNNYILRGSSLTAFAHMAQNPYFGGAVATSSHVR